MGIIKSCEWNQGGKSVEAIKMILLYFLKLCCCIYVSLRPNNNTFHLQMKLVLIELLPKAKKPPAKQTNKTSSALFPICLTRQILLKYTFHI